MSKASLKFGPGEPSGFTDLMTATFNDAPPARILRELLQNSLDAAVEAGVRTANVRFEVSYVRRDEVPDIGGYERTFREAVEYHLRMGNGRLSDPAQQVVDTIDNALGKDSVRTLSVLDNGVGFDKRRMTAVLSDGSGVKDDSAAGSYGVGHFSAVAASDLRYLLYGGVLKSGRRIGSGFAILAGRPGKRHPRAARGYFVRKSLGGIDRDRFEFAVGDEVPAIIRSALSKIRRKWRHGSAVMIPGFNCFGEDARLTEIIPLVAALNFSAAIHAGKLVVEVDEGVGEGAIFKRVDRKNLRELLESVRDRVRSFRRDTLLGGLRPSGQVAWATYEALCKGRQAKIPTMMGKASVYLLVPAPLGRTRLDLFRNGMWITDNIPELAPSVFADRREFHAVLMPVQHSHLHRLVRKAEGPMHDELSPKKRLSEIEREQLGTALRAIATWLKDEVPRMKAEAYSPDDFLVVPSGGEGHVGGSATYSMWGEPVIVRQARRRSQRRIDPRDGEDAHLEQHRGGARRSRPRGKARSQRSRPLPFRSTGVPDGGGRYRIEIECTEAADDVVLRFRIDENADATCDRLWQDEEVVIKSFTATDTNGVAVAGHLESDGGGTSVRLQGLAAGTYRIAMEYKVPPGFDETVHAPVFRVDLARPID